MNVAFEIFGLEVKWYGIIIALGVLVACFVAVYNCKQKKLNEDMPFEILLWCFPLAIIGARLYYIAFSGQTYSFNEAIAIWNGGMAIYGGLIGGIVGIILYCLIRKQNFWQILDIVAPSLIIAQSIGRWGNFANQEVYGTIVTNPDLQFFPFSVYIDALGEWHYATFFYESMLNLLGFILLMWLFRKSNLKGLVTAMYLVWYGIVRFFLEGIRETTEILFIPGTNVMVSQVVSLILVALGLALLAYIFRKEIKTFFNKIFKRKNNQSNTDLKIENIDADNDVDMVELNKNLDKINQNGKSGDLGQDNEIKVEQTKQEGN